MALEIRVKYRLLNPRCRSLTRGNTLVLCSLSVALFLSDFPHNRATVLLFLPALVSLVGLVDTLRCMQPRWNFYHGGVLLCVYMDLMAISMILFFLIYPYMPWLVSTH
jgi:hypothetical protein